MSLHEKQMIKYSDRKYTGFIINTFPDGQREILLRLDELDVKRPVNIVCSIKHFNDLEVLISLVKALKNNDFIINSIDFKYLMGMRSDRTFQKGMCNYFRDVIAPIINSLDIKHKVFFEPHSFATSYIRRGYGYSFNGHHEVGAIEILGDMTHAIKRDDFFARDLYFIKKRSESGAIESISLPDKFITEIKARKEYLPLIIVDDLCDGGATFIAEADYLRLLFPNRKIYLSIAHALFSKGIDHVAKHFEKIYCSNSYQDIEHEKVIQEKVI